MMTLKMTSYPLFLIWILIGTNKCGLAVGQSGGGTTESDKNFDLDIDADFNIANNGPKTQFNLGVNVGDGNGNGGQTAACKSVNGRMIDQDCISSAGNKGSKSTCSSYCGSKAAVVPEPTNLSNFIAIYRIIFPELKGKSIWLSATDAAKEKLWKWPSGKVLSNSDPNWANKNYPRNMTTSNCLRFYGSTSISSRAYLLDYSCSYTNFNCICQH